MFFYPPPKKKNPIGTKILDTSLLPNYDYYTLNNGQISYLQPLPQGLSGTMSASAEYSLDLSTTLNKMQISKFYQMTSRKIKAWGGGGFTHQSFSLLKVTRSLNFVWMSPLPIF